MTLQNAGLQPETLSSGEPSGLLSVNLFWEHKRAQLCRTNCKEIQVPQLFPLSYADQCEFEDFDDEENRETLNERAFDKEPMASQDEQEAFGLISNQLSQSRVSSASLTSSDQGPFNFLGLPLELRLKIYGYLLPARHHKIVTQLPHNGFFYNTSSIPVYSAQSFYPFGTRAPNNLTTYKILSSNSHQSYPHKSIEPAIIGTSKQIKEEAETVLYGNGESKWDFGLHLDACQVFWKDRSATARSMVKSLRVAKEIPATVEVTQTLGVVDEKWAQFCNFLENEMTGLRTLDLTMWAYSGSTSPLPIIPIAAPESLPIAEDREAELENEKHSAEVEKQWRDWDWVSKLMQMGALRTAKITWWGAENGGADAENRRRTFDSWLASRMVADNVVRENMIRDGVVVQGVVVVRGGSE